MAMIPWTIAPQSEHLPSFPSTVNVHSLPSSPSNRIVTSGYIKLALPAGCFSPPPPYALWGCCLIRARTVHAPCILLGIVYYPDPERLIFSHNIRFFMAVVDVGQLFSCWLTIACPLFEHFLF